MTKKAKPKSHLNPNIMVKTEKQLTPVQIVKKLVKELKTTYGLKNNQVTVVDNNINFTMSNPKDDIHSVYSIIVEGEGHVTYLLSQVTNTLINQKTVKNLPRFEYDLKWFDSFIAQVKDKDYSRFEELALAINNVTDTSMSEKEVIKVVKDIYNY